MTRFFAVLCAVVLALGWAMAFAAGVKEEAPIDRGVVTRLLGSPEIAGYIVLSSGTYDVAERNYARYRSEEDGPLKEEKVERFEVLKQPASYVLLKPKSRLDKTVAVYERTLPQDVYEKLTPDVYGINDFDHVFSGEFLPLFSEGVYLTSELRILDLGDAGLYPARLGNLKLMPPDYMGVEDQMAVAVILKYPGNRAVLVYEAFNEADQLLATGQALAHIKTLINTTALKEKLVIPPAEGLSLYLDAERKRKASPEDEN